jgi:pimeloyl-ACP methyl ester carboxylesterase
MNRLMTLVLMLLTYFASAAWPQALKPTQPLNQKAQLPHFPRRAVFPQMAQLFERVRPAIAPASATKDVVWVQCPPDAQAWGALCGNVAVPLDRKHPTQGTINIYFELYVHYGPGPAESAFLVNPGLPGLATSGVRDLVLAAFSAILDVHDILLIDDRGRGFSGTIVCNPLQYGTEAFDPAVADCAAQLGNAASRYGTGDIAQDVEAVRAALGYDQVDYYGVAYGGGDVTAYATRFGDHLRSIVLDGPGGTPLLNEVRFVGGRWFAQALPRIVTLDCQRSPTCSADHPNPEAKLNKLVRTIRRDPVEGDAYDANGNLIHVRINEETLLSYVLGPINVSGTFVNYGEILAAADSLERGDTGPLLRLGAEGYAPLDYANYGDPTFFSEGAGMATICADMHVPWDWSDPVSERKDQLAEAVAALPMWYFAPFSKRAMTAEDCLYWQKPTPSSPMAPPHATYPPTPTLVLTGDLDNIVPTEAVRKVTALFPDSTLVPVAGAGHLSLFWSQCALNLALGFIETLQLGDTSCAKTPEIVWSALGRFPPLAADARPAAVDPNGQNQIGLHERKVMTVAVATATDALQRSFIGSGNGVGLRAGTFSTDYGDGSIWTTTLTNCAFSEDVTVNGTVTWNYYGAFVADLTLSGSGTAGGTLHIEGTWQAPGPVGNFNVSGTLGGKQVAVLVPEA